MKLVHLSDSTELPSCKYNVGWGFLGMRAEMAARWHTKHLDYTDGVVQNLGAFVRCLCYVDLRSTELDYPSFYIRADIKCKDTDGKPIDGHFNTTLWYRLTKLNDSNDILSDLVEITHYPDFFSQHQCKVPDVPGRFWCQGSEVKQPQPNLIFNHNKVQPAREKGNR